MDLKPPIPRLLTFLKSRTTEELSRQMAALWQWLQWHKPDAVLTSDMEVPRMIRDFGYRIPRDIALAGTTTLASWDGHAQECPLNNLWQFYWNGNGIPQGHP